MDRIEIQPGYSISRIIKGGWHLAGGHGAIDEQQAIGDMRAFVEAGITTFDCADIYTGVEVLIGKFLKKYKSDFNSGDLPSVQIHTKYVPDYDALPSLSKEDTIRVIDRSLQRLQVDRLDLVQFAWWDFNIPGYIETGQHLTELQKQGKIRYIGVTNFNGKNLGEMLDAGIPVITTQVQYSLLDHRPEGDLRELVEAKNIFLLCYGVVAGGFLSERYVDISESKEPLENRSLVKYRLIIDEFGGYDLFQQVLRVLKIISDKHNVGISEVAARYILQKPSVAGVIIGARNQDHLFRLMKISNLHLDGEDLKMIHTVISMSQGPKGAVYGLESDKKGKHGAIMRYNLNKQRDAS
ncbi:MAG: aldo/keto reductase [Flammeovirgaceae bacterium]|nr:aldo/keto reductase [Flammeovirgaceae bacterium]